MKICKIREVKTPNRAHYNDAGIDFFVPAWSEEFEQILKEKNNERSIFIDSEKIILPAGERILIPSGIKAIIPENYALIAFDKSGVGSKKGLTLLAKVVDELYRGEIHINLTNVSNKSQIISYNEKIVQFILIPVFYDIVEEIPEDEYNLDKTERGEGGFGSTNK